MAGNRHIIALAAALAALLPSLTGCRRMLYVAGDEFHSAVLHTDWRYYSGGDPDGMTAWFYPVDAQTPAYRLTTSEVHRAEFFLPTGEYTGVVIDYSPDEYGRQEFLGMDYAQTALVRATEAGYQPEPGAEELYGPAAYSRPLPEINEETGLYRVLNQPEQMAVDTLDRMRVQSGDYGYYIPYPERDTYQTDFTVRDFYAYPASPVWRMRIRVYVKGIDYLYQTEASVAGLSEGRYLALNRTSEQPCLISVQDWEVQRTGTNVGYIAATLSTFGLPADRHPNNTSTKGDDGAPPVLLDWSGTDPLSPEDIRLNLRFLLRDRETVRYYHFDVGENVVSFDDQLVLRIDLDETFPDGIPDLPYVEPYNSAGFDAEVTPWEDGGNAEVGM